jgi:hypothetical protein
MDIKILGKTSSKRDYLIAVVQTALFELGLDSKIIKIEDEVVLESYNLDSLPAMLLNDKVVLAGNVPGISDIKNMISTANL